jgi:formate-dependent nitrite reductase membrane component NrfD
MIMNLLTPNIQKALMVVGGLILVVVLFSYVIFPDVICKSAQENARNTPASGRIDPIVETCKGAAIALSR